MFKNLRWTIVLLLFLVYMINYLDRVALSLTLPLIERDLTLNAAEFGMIFSSFFFGYAIFNFVGGLATDNFAPRWCSAWPSAYGHCFAGLPRWRPASGQCSFFVCCLAWRKARFAPRLIRRLTAGFPKGRPPRPWACSVPVRRSAVPLPVR